MSDDMRESCRTPSDADGGSALHLAYSRTALLDSSGKNKKQTLSSRKELDNQYYTDKSFHSSYKAAWLCSVKAATAGRLGNFKTSALTEDFTKKSQPTRNIQPAAHLILLQWSCSCLTH
ncbi:hypothetical protein AV530_016491 [Patagioenas fasciata monilis]|uniref:Uncharacterized protein n=1 Tax=Patagioenas fasciata monilis TaxID=372326 RepID=A0A1V4J2A9_PATFA|nr:hypothetical protein AV530_016491 [Patagioenas fasciata monilis]